MKCSHALKVAAIKRIINEVPYLKICVNIKILQCTTPETLTFTMITSIVVCL